MPNESESFAQITLDGARFTGGRLPLDAMVELERYQKVVLEAAKIEWLEDHPEMQVPADFAVGFELFISEITPGSAVLDIQRPVVRQTYKPYYKRGRNQYSRQLNAVMDPTVDVMTAPLLAVPEFRATGASLSPGDTVLFDSTAATVPTTLLTPEDRDNLFALRIVEYDKAIKRQKIKRHTDSGMIAGRLTALDANTQGFTLDSLHHGKVTGRYKNPGLTADLKAVLDSSTVAPVVRLKSELRYLEDELKLISDVSNVELLEIDGMPWSRRFVELAGLSVDWSGEGGGAEMISFTALDAAGEILSNIHGRDGRIPGIFPMEDGGIQLEWASRESVSSVEVSPDAHFVLFALPPGSDIPTEKETNNLELVLEFVREVTE